MQNCARYANDEMIDSDRLFFGFHVGGRIFVSFILCSFICIDGKWKRPEKTKKKPRKKKGNCGYERIWRIGRQSEANRYSQQIHEVLLPTTEYRFLTSEQRLG